MLKLSTGLKNSLLGNATLKGTSLAYHDGGAGNDYITDSENRFLDAGFKVGDKITTTGSTTGGNDMTDVEILAVSAGKLEFATGTVAAEEAFNENTVLKSNNGGSLEELFKDAVLEIYSGSQPADADSGETGTKLVRITLNSGAFTPGSPTNGLEFEAPMNGVIGKKSGDVWSGVGLADGTAGWFRLYDNKYHTGDNKAAVRLDGACGVGSGQLKLSSLTIKEGVTITIDSFDIDIRGAS